MRIQYVALVAAATVAASTHGLEVVPDPVKFSLLQATAETGHQADVDGKINRFLTSKDADLPHLVAPAGYAPSLLQKGGIGRYLRSTGVDDADLEERRGWHKHHKKHKKHKRKHHHHAHESSDSL